jgi:hypothetical protein
LTALGIDVEGKDGTALKPGPNPYHARVRAILGEGGKLRMVIGLAAQLAPAGQDRP